MNGEQMEAMVRALRDEPTPKKRGLGNRAAWLLAAVIIAAGLFKVWNEYEWRRRVVALEERQAVALERLADWKQQ